MTNPVVNSKNLPPNTFTQESLEHCLAVVKEALDDLKAKNITVLDVADLTDVTERMVIAEGTSNRHLKSLADHVAYEAKQAGFPSLGVEGQGTTDWTLIDLGAVVVHVMMPQARAFYDLEGLWKATNRETQVQSA